MGGVRLTGDWSPGRGPLPSVAEGPTSRRTGLVQKAATDWKNALVDLGGRNNLLYYRDLKRGTLDLTAGDRDALYRLVWDANALAFKVGKSWRFGASTWSSGPPSSLVEQIANREGD
jgi:hypothetical protein